MNGDNDNDNDNDRVLYEGCSDTNARIANRLQTFLVHQEVANWGKYFLIINRNVLDFKLSQT